MRPQLQQPSRSRKSTAFAVASCIDHTGGRAWSILAIYWADAFLVSRGYGNGNGCHGSAAAAEVRERSQRSPLDGEVRQRNAGSIHAVSYPTSQGSWKSRVGNSMN